MPFYEYQCSGCKLTESRVAGVDDQWVHCTSCGGRMGRTTGQDDLFRAYWETSEKAAGKKTGSV